MDKTNDYSNLSYADKSKVQITLTKMLANDVTGTLTIGYQLSVDGKNGKKITSPEKLFTLSGFSTSADQTAK